MSVILGLFVGGRGTRMGGVDKSALPTPAGPSILERTVSLAEGLGLRVFLVGDGAPHARLPRLVDTPTGVGPLGGLAALLAEAGEGHALALACDMPFVAEADLAALVASPSSATVLAARTGEHWEPLFARYHAPRARPIVAALLAEGRRALSAVVERAGAEVFTPTDPRTVLDWDTPEDRAR